MKIAYDEKIGKCLKLTNKVFPVIFSKHSRQFDVKKVFYFAVSIFRLLQLSNDLSERFAIIFGRVSRMMTGNY